MVGVVRGVRACVRGATRRGGGVKSFGDINISEMMRWARTGRRKGRNTAAHNMDEYLTMRVRIVRIRMNVCVGRYDRRESSCMCTMSEERSDAVG